MKAATLLSLTILLSSCHQEYIQNKLTITKITCTHLNTKEHYATIAFGVSYYTDSTYKGNSGSIQKGQSCSDDSIIFFGTPGKNAYIALSDRRYIKGHKQTTFTPFIEGFNKHVEGYCGQQLDSGYRDFTFALTAEQCAEQEIILVQYRKKTGRVDTLRATLKPEN